MKAMVSAAGKGTRLFPGELLKPMAQVVNKPIIRHIFELLARTGVEGGHVNDVNYPAGVILGRYGQDLLVEGMKVSVAREPLLAGTAGGVKRLADRFAPTRLAGQRVAPSRRRDRLANFTGCGAIDVLVREACVLEVLPAKILLAGFGREKEALTPYVRS